jgi:hypothetical protein
MMKKHSYNLLYSTTAAILLVGCGGGSSSDYNPPPSNVTPVYELAPQGGTQNYLFFGEANLKSLGSLSNVRVISSEEPEKILVQNDDTSDVGYSIPSTTLTYDPTTGSYSNLHVKTLSYISDGVAYTVPMEKDGSTPSAQRNSSATHLSDTDYTKVDYLGSTQYLVAHDDDMNTTVLITPDMGPSNAPVNFGDRKLLSVTYPSYGEAVNGYLVYDNGAREVQRCTLDMTQCAKVNIDAGSRDFEEDILGTTYSAFLIDDELYRVNKADGSVLKIDLGGKAIATGHGTTSFNGSSFYFIAEDQNLYRADMLAQTLTKITAAADERLERIRGFTTDYVIYGSDTILKAGKKDGTTTSPVVLAETTFTGGYKYVTNYGIGDDYLFVTYSINPDTKDTRYSACIFNEGTPQCKENSFWAGATLKKEGKRRFESNFTYTPYAYIRVDDTDDFGGGTLKAIDPAHPFDDGITMGSIAKYNFQTFLSNSRYLDEMIDGDGGIVFFAKNDTTFHVDAFYFNLLKKNSLVQLTNTDPFPDVTHGRDHCHGRHCMICHNFAGGKIYTDLDGSKSAYGYRIRLDFEDGTQTLADVAKGAGENFSLPLKNMVGNFKANVLDENGTVVNSSAGYHHEGIKSADCNFCHARGGNPLYDAPGTISIKQ